MTTIEEAILKLDRKLKDIPFDFAFLGGSVLSLLVTDPMADAIRVTKDVDVMMNIRTRRDYHRVDAMLERLGFRHDTRDAAPICRWIFEDVICLFNGRGTIVEEIAGCTKLRRGLAEKFRRYLTNPDLEDAIEGFVQTETNPVERKSALMAKFGAVANLA